MGTLRGPGKKRPNSGPRSPRTRVGLPQLGCGRKSTPPAQLMPRSRILVSNGAGDAGIRLVKPNPRHICTTSLHSGPGQAPAQSAGCMSRRGCMTTRSTAVCTFDSYQGVPSLRCDPARPGGSQGSARLRGRILRGWRVRLRVARFDSPGRETMKHPLPRALRGIPVPKRGQSTPQWSVFPSVPMWRSALQRGVFRNAGWYTHTQTSTRNCARDAAAVEKARHLRKSPSRGQNPHHAVYSVGGRRRKRPCATQRHI